MTTDSLFSSEMFAFWIDKEKLPYFTFPYSIIDRKDDTVKIEVRVYSNTLGELVYAGVQYGIDLMSKKHAV
jgi:hypothetical protein